MNKENLENIISKYINNEASKSEIEELLVWLEDSKNEKVFIESIAMNHYLNKNFKEFDSVKAYRESLNIYNEPRNKRRISPYFKYAVAASIVLLISLTFIFNKDKTGIVEPIIVNNNIEIGTDKATLTLEDGTNVTLEKGQDYVTDNLSSNGEKLTYNPKANTKPEVAYNYLTIARGGQYHVKLSDGTEVWLNSESKLKYPVNFIEGEERQIELVYGEAYFIVSPSAAHKGSNFKVKTGIQEIEVLGTRFNIKAYEDEDYIYTTLVEGKVSIYNTSSLEILKPSQQSILNIASKEVKINTIDVGSEIAWIHGDFIFNRKPLKDIMKVLSRWYDVEIEFENKELEDIKFFGELSKYQSIEDILTLIKTTNKITTFEINNDKILIK